MKKLLLLPILIASIAYPQDKSLSALENAKTYLVTDPCNNTGLAWVDKALSYDADNKEALGYISNCHQHKFDEAMAVLESNPLDKKSISTITGLSKLEKFSNEKVHYLIANYNIENGRPLNNVREDITIALGYNPTNLEYRWIRVRSNLNEMSGLNLLKEAIDDMIFMIENGANTGVVNINLGVAYEEFARSVPKPIYPNTFKDENPEYDKKLKDYYDMVIENYSNAVESYKKAVEIDPELNNKLRLKIPTLENNIASLKIESNQ